jgi:hypothetical protein
MTARGGQTMGADLTQEWCRAGGFWLWSFADGGYWPISACREGLKSTRSSQSTRGHNLDGVYQWTAEST